MKKIINGKRYDTDVAKVQGNWYPSGISRNSFSFFEETLYLTKSGNWFLHGEGGGNTRYAERVGDAWTRGEKIVPISEDEARRWVEEHFEVEDYDRIFGEVQDDDMVQFSCIIPQAIKEKIDRLKKKGGCTQAELIVRLVEKAEE